MNRSNTSLGCLIVLHWRARSLSNSIGRWPFLARTRDRFKKSISATRVQAAGLHNVLRNHEEMLCDACARGLMLRQSE